MEYSAAPNALSLPPGFADRVARLWPDEGRRWLDDLPGRVAGLAARWRLEDVAVFGDLSVAFVAFARLPSGREVVLKVGVPHRELFGGFEAQRRFEGTRGCRVVDVAPEEAAILLERVRPGTPLSEEPDARVRVAAAAEMVRDLPVPVRPGDEALFPTFADLLAASLASAERLPAEARPEGIDAVLESARRVFAGLQDERRPLRLLHGDLRHENVLRAEDGGWRCIDPHGWLGVAVLDAGRFFQHEMYRCPATEQREALRGMVADVARLLGEDRRAVAASAYLNSVRTACWALGRPDRPEVLRENLERMDWIEDWL